MMRTPVIPTVLLSGNISMPQVGYGVFQIRDYGTCKQCVREAIGLGYRLFDTASAYFNEDAVGDACAAAISDGEVRREDLFLTTKVWLQDFGEKETEAAVERSLRNLRTDYLDLVLLHQPYGRWQEAWRSLEKLQKKGLIRAIGTSNFTPGKMQELLSFAHGKPQVNQIEIHPFYTEDGYTEELHRENIQPEAWGPLNEGQRNIFRNPILTEIGKSHGKTAAQTALRWNLQKGNVVIPKSTNPDHMKENLDIFDFELTSKEMTEIESMDLGRSEIIDFENPATERLLMKLKIHA